MGCCRDGKLFISKRFKSSIFMALFRDYLFWILLCGHILWNDCDAMERRTEMED